jgi:hypothetical protein
MTSEEAIRVLEREWDLDSGFLGRLRQGEFDATTFEHFEELLGRLPTKGDMLDARLVALTWYVPLFMTWQRERCLANGSDVAAFDKAVNRATCLVEEALGVP